MYDSKNSERPLICLQKWLLNQKVNLIKWKVRIGMSVFKRITNINEKYSNVQKFEFNIDIEFLKNLNLTQRRK